MNKLEKYQLSVVIPVHNFAESLENLFTQLDEFDPNLVQIIAVDDGSTDGTFELLSKFAKGKPHVQVLQNEKNLGAGVARNRGFSKSNGRFTYFFDSDDILHVPEIWFTVNELESTEASVSLNSYNYLRKGSGYTGMNEIDVSLWDNFWPQFGGDPFALDDAAPLLEFTNYPWNKIIRTSHYKEHMKTGLFGSTTVNNDILGHWKILLESKEIIMVDRPIASHLLSTSERHLSNRFGEERLQLFDALDETRKLLESNSYWLSRYCHVYWGFAMRVIRWARSKIDPRWQQQFDYKSRDLVSRISFVELGALKKRNQNATYEWIIDTLS